MNKNVASGNISNEKVKTLIDAYFNSDRQTILKTIDNLPPFIFMATRLALIELLDIMDDANEIKYKNKEQQNEAPKQLKQVGVKRLKKEW